MSLCRKDVSVNMSPNSSQETMQRTVEPSNRIFNKRRNLVKNDTVAAELKMRAQSSRSQKLPREREKSAQDKMDEAALFDIDFFHDLIKRGETIHQVDGDNVDRWLAYVFMEALKTEDSSFKTVFVTKNLTTQSYHLLDH